jgi:hypothetical protein
MSPIINQHIDLTSTGHNSWRERRDEVILIDDTETDDRENNLVDDGKLEALLSRIENTKSELEHTDDNVSQYRMRDLIVNLVQSAEQLQQIEQS